MNDPSKTVFISWSGTQSNRLAKRLCTWITAVVPGIQTWMSEADIHKGSPWLAQLSDCLSTSAAGVVVVTAENYTAPWLVFEAGVISKALSHTRCCPVLFGVRPADLSGPLSIFQHTEPTEEDMRRLQQTLNSVLGDAAHSEPNLKMWFDAFWNEAHSDLMGIVAEQRGAPAPKSPEIQKLDEILLCVRNIERTTGVRPTQFVSLETASRMKFPVMRQDAWYHFGSGSHVRVRFTDEAYQSYLAQPPIVRTEATVAAMTGWRLPHIQDISTAEGHRYRAELANTWFVFVPADVGPNAPQFALNPKSWEIIQVEGRGYFSRYWPTPGPASP